MPKITKTLVDGLKPKESGDLFVWDTELRGFGLRMKPSGSASFIVQYKTPQGATRRMVVSQAGAMTPDEARKTARARLATVEQGRDPSAERHEKRDALTVAELCRLYLEAARSGLVMTRFGQPKRASTVAIDEGRVSRHIVPLIGTKIAAELTRADVQRMADAIASGKTAAKIKTKARGVACVTGGAGTAARVVELLGGVWTWAERRNHVAGTNPAHGVETKRGTAKDRVLSRDELTALGGAIEKAAKRSPSAASALRLIALAGLRREEACGLRWREVDFDGSCLRLEATKTGRSMRPLGKPAIDLLRAIPRVEGEEFLFPGRGDAKAADLKKQIAAIFDAAGLKDARSHDLRRTFATMAAELGWGDALIAELLGHAKRGVTERHYIRRPDAVIILAADKVSSAIARAMRGEHAEVVPIRADHG